MKRAMTYVALWGGATTLAMLLVWFGARPVLHNAVSGAPPARLVVSSPSAPASARSPSPADESSTVATRSPRPTPPVRQDRTYVVEGGRVVLAMTATTVRLVSATPDPGYEVRTWHNSGWLRVDFVNGHDESTLFASWAGHAPTVRVDDGGQGDE